MVDSVVIVSGGMDSVTLLYHLVQTEQRHPAVMTFRYGQKHDREIACAQYHARLLGCEPHLIADLAPLRAVFSGSALVDAGIDVPDMDQVTGDPQPITYVPNRNMIFLALAAAFAESLGTSAVYYGAQRHDLYGYWDTTPDFLERLNQVYALNRKTPVRIEAPFVQSSKAELLRIGLALGVDYGQTWSCYRGGEAACGRCPTCAERLQAFAEIGQTDPLPYEAH
ncbi:MAG: 7-cyano-7-deazaguanine synthase QueC [Anaerolineae bacterium]|nr:7-cyano-7-deazaguanine synthase QueC [Anaerolineae bacterium]